MIKYLLVYYDIISELTTFAQKHQSFEAEEGCNDDLANVSCYIFMVSCTRLVSRK